jgi:hypothetical protein
MASVEQQNTVQIDPGELVNSVIDEDASLAVRRLFTIPGRDPFDEIEWEIRDAFIPGKDGPVFESRPRTISRLAAPCACVTSPRRPASRAVGRIYQPR